MEMNQRILVTAERGHTQVPGFDMCCDDCGGLCRDLVELLSPQERGALISEFRAARRNQIAAGELRAALTGAFA